MIKLLKKLFNRKKPIIFTSIEADRRYKEDDPYPPGPWKNDLDNSINWDVGNDPDKGKKGNSKRNTQNR